ncbi:hypothetical protein [Streptomyces longwoodensis]|uniref:hypothetical protein n=1 Tax=Streptomyces longwoodensis TaxID=68231 RepID=UPI00384AD044
MDIEYGLIGQFAERHMVYRITAPDLAPEDTEYRFAISPQTVRLTYTSTDGAPWTLYSLEIAGLRVRKDGTVNPASFSHVTRCYPDSEHFQRFKPLWLRNFAEQHRVPPAVTPDPAA